MTRKIQVMEYQDDWETAFQELKAFFEQQINCPSFRIEHVGSTSVRGLIAKSIIDFVILIPDKSYFECIKKSLERLHYYHNGNQGIMDREVFKQMGPSNFHAHHLYVSYPTSLSTRNQITLRDHLRTHPKDREAYGNLKVELAKKYESDIDAYTHGKTEFIVSILSQYDFTESEIKSIRSNNE